MPSFKYQIFHEIYQRLFTARGITCRYFLEYSRTYDLHGQELSKDVELFLKFSLILIFLKILNAFTINNAFFPCYFIWNNTEKQLECKAAPKIFLSERKVNNKKSHGNPHLGMGRRITCISPLLLQPWW